MHAFRWCPFLIVFVSAAMPYGKVARSDDNSAGVRRESMAAEMRLAENLRSLSSDQMEGRGVGTVGLDKAAEYVAGYFARLGLNTRVIGEQPFQVFQLATGTEPGDAQANTLKLRGPGDNGELQVIEGKLGHDFTPLAVGGNGQVEELDAVFVGYGITAKERDPATQELREYDEYQGVDVRGKAVVMIRKEPQQRDTGSIFNGDRPSRHAEFRTKIANAIDHGAAAIIMVNDEVGLKVNILSDEKAWNDALDQLARQRAEFQALVDPTAEQIARHRSEVARLAESIQVISKRFEESGDQLVPFRGAGNEPGDRKVPIVFCRRALMDRALRQVMDKDLATIEREIDADLKPQSRPLSPWKISCQVTVKTNFVQVKNVIGVLEGEGPLADETIIVGAHYDHLGMGGAGSLAPWTAAVHNGADDNGSGTVAMMEIAHQFAVRGSKPRRRIVFMAFTAEERGLLGSRHYVKNPVFPLEKTVAMLNLDMVGRLTDDSLIVFGTGTAAEFNPWLDELNKNYQFMLTRHSTGVGPSDQTPFVERQIPVFHFFTGLHDEYHRPADDFELINVAGIGKVAALVEDLVDRIAQAEKPPKFQEVRGEPAPAIGRIGRPQPFFGAAFDQQKTEALTITELIENGPAAAAGLKVGDVIVMFGERKIQTFGEFTMALKRFSAGNEVPTVVLRNGETVTVKVIVAAPR
ncbi:MAG: M20/M25/M40 family metallo-hydrolase [Planctomycetes bacterium]|nr:M20/M25/M40 family metallo-hydrolase [Planctomycetota bacterium]